MGALVLTSTAVLVDPDGMRRRAHLAACSMHSTGGGSPLCEMGRVASGAVLEWLAAFLRDPTSGAAQTVLEALREDTATDPWGSPLTRAQRACDALADLLDGGA